MNHLRLHFAGLLSLFLIVLFPSSSISQTADKKISVVVTADHTDWVYRLGEPATFSVQVLEGDQALRNGTIKYSIGPEKMEPTLSGNLKMDNKIATIKGGTMNTAGFLRCTITAEVNGKTYSGLATAAYQPELIQPTAVLPTDFMEFWDKVKADNAKIPMDAKVTPLPELTTEKVKVFMVSIQNFRIGSRIYGILSVPNKPGKFPAVLEVPGAGIRAYKGNAILAEKGLITFQIGIHGIPVNLPNQAYADLSNSALNGYPMFNMDNKDTYYYKRVYAGCVRAVDFILSLPEYDGSNLAVSGGSQGGALSIVTAALDPRVKMLRAFYPALSDVTGYLHNRAGGWPHVFNATNGIYHNTPQKIATAQYYDVVNFARFVKVPGFYSWGFNDVTCPPTSMYASYNLIKAPKELAVYKETGHNTVPEQVQAYYDWLLKNLIKQ